MELNELFQLYISEAEKPKIFSIKEANNLIPKISLLISRHKEAIESLNIDFSSAWEMGLNLINEEKIRQTINFNSGNTWLKEMSKLYSFLRPELSETEAYTIAFELASEISSINTIYSLFELSSLENKIRNPFDPIIKIIDLGALPRGFREINYKKRFIVEFPSIIQSTPTFLVYIEGGNQILHYRKPNSKIIEELPSNLIY